MTTKQLKHGEPTKAFECLWEWADIRSRELSQMGNTSKLASDWSQSSRFPSFWKIALPIPFIVVFCFVLFFNESQTLEIN